MNVKSIINIVLVLNVHVHKRANKGVAFCYWIMSFSNL